MKTCKKCGETKPLGDFYKANGTLDGLRGECKACNIAAQRAKYSKTREARVAAARRWQEKNPERVRAYRKEYNERPERKAAMRQGHLLRKFGITQADYDRLLGEQGGGCAICGDPPEEGKHLHVDHDHVTGAVRGLLCVRCNNGAGQFLEDPDLLRQAAVYLEAVDAAEEVALAKQRVAELVRATGR